MTDQPEHLDLRSIGMAWTPGEPLPKPQVLYEEDR